MTELQMYKEVLYTKPAVATRILNSILRSVGVLLGKADACALW